MKNKHHRKCRSNGGTQGTYKGEKFIVWVDAKKHTLWHLLFNNNSPEQIIDEINRQWIDPRFEITLKRR